MPMVPMAPPGMVPMEPPGVPQQQIPPEWHTGPFISVVIACDRHPESERCTFVHKGPVATMEQCKALGEFTAHDIADNPRDPRDVAGSPYCMPKKFFDEAAINGSA